jgi:hypothetical protein
VVDLESVLRETKVAFVQKSGFGAIQEDSQEEYQESMGEEGMSVSERSGRREEREEREEDEQSDMNSSIEDISISFSANPPPILTDSISKKNIDFHNQPS